MYYLVKQPHTSNKRLKSRFLPHTINKNKSTWIKGLHMKNKTVKYSEGENIYENTFMIAKDFEKKIHRHNP